jgi:hypothetical protein
MDWWLFAKVILRKWAGRPLACNCGGTTCRDEIAGGALTFLCRNCGRVTLWCRGAADNYEEDCDDCAWLKMVAEPAPHN